MSSTLNRIAIPVFSIAAGLIVLLSGPAHFDAVDGAEFAVAGSRLEIAHPPGYPLYLSALRLTGMTAGFDYRDLRLLNCIFAGLAYWAGTIAFRSLQAGKAGSLMGPMVFLTLPPVLSQTNVLEVHSLAILLVMFAVAFRNSRAGPYLFSLAVFGGHPTSIALLPLVWSNRYRSRWALMALLPATLWLYVPLRAGAASITHYSHPDGLLHFLGYLRMYGNRLSIPSAGNLAGIAGFIGPVCGLVLIFLITAGWSRCRRLLFAALPGILFLSIYTADDIESLAWLALLPLSILAARGFSSLWEWRRTGAVTGIVLALSSCIWGTRAACRNDDDIAWLLSRDMLGSTSLNAVYCTVSHDTFYSAYLTAIEDRRPDIVPVDIYSLYFSMSLDRPLPTSIGDRSVFATRAWSEQGFSLNGLVFSGPGNGAPDWEELDIFRFQGRSPDRRARDAMAESWARRAIQTDDPLIRDSFAQIALDWASTAITRERISGLIENFPH